MRTLTLNSSFGAALVALALAGCPGDSSDDTTTETTNTTPAQTDPTPGTTSTDGTTGENPTSSTDPDDTTGTTGTTDDTTGTPPDDTTGTPPDDTTGTPPDDTTGAPDDTTGAPDDTTGGGGGDLSFAVDIYAPIIMARCSCHVNGASGGLSMPDAATAYANLVGIPATIAPLNRVEAGDSDASYIFHKVNGTQADVGGGGGQMPLGGGPLDGGQISDIANWIDQGALP